MLMSKGNKAASEKPAILWGLSSALLFAILNILSLYWDIHILSYFSAIPAIYIVFWFIARVTK